MFHGCAWAAYLDQAREQQGPPDCVATRQRAYAYYEAALAEKNRRKSRPEPAGHWPAAAATTGVKATDQMTGSSPPPKSTAGSS